LKKVSKRGAESKEMREERWEEKLSKKKVIKMNKNRTT
jgi:hypothetical protein